MSSSSLVHDNSHSLTTIRLVIILCSITQVLLPLVNIPMLEYTLESLAATGVREILVVCCAHAEQVRVSVCACAGRGIFGRGEGHTLSLCHYLCGTERFCSGWVDDTLNPHFSCIEFFLST